VLIVITDDQRAGTLDGMPLVEHSFRDQGVYFPNAFATTPLCCPARASIMTGQYVHNHGVRHFDPYKLNQQTTIQSYLSSSGCRTAFFGKYLNAWQLEDNPPHFDEWATFPQSTRETYSGGPMERQWARSTSRRLLNAIPPENGKGFRAPKQRSCDRCVALANVHLGSGTT
jgi:arylsulfatase A-like enzyme